MSLKLVLGSGVREDGRGVDGYRYGMFRSKHGAKKKNPVDSTRNSILLGRSLSLSGRKHHHEVAEYGILILIHVFR